jgi:hypothetical protein
MDEMDHKGRDSLRASWPGLSPAIHGRTMPSRKRSKRQSPLGSGDGRGADGRDKRGHDG